ncbi:LtfC-like domain-containing protein [Mycobacterium paragordonae]|uniref:LtfC/p132/Gp6 beta-sandwich domain-containing protein n=1 Tax=Mycobacterium paragordonae TaxID=1389713 RepID=A0AAJ1W253_9MYCO|nr:hypothetical protein [Mycobacterium paragordonae]MDP7733654.1 hypothetical protein [Mycobacterium paragordonae]
MSDIGVALDLDRLVLTRGRDFKWSFENVNAQGLPVDFPDGDLFFELGTHGEHNGAGHFEMYGADGGSYTVGIEGDAGVSDPLPFDASEQVLKQAIEGLAGIGAGNVSVVGYFTPQWIFIVDWSDAMPLSAGVVELFNATVSAAFGALDFITGGLGVTLDGHYESSSFVFRLTYKGSLLQQELINFVAGVISNIIDVINTALTNIEIFSGEIANIDAIYAPIRRFYYEFVNDKALTPVNALTVTPSLTGHTPSLTVTQDAKGRAPFTIWDFDITGSTASIKVESDDCDVIPSRTPWQLVFMPDGEASGGDPIARGKTWTQE